MNGIIKTIENINNILIENNANKGITKYIKKSLVLQKKLLDFKDNYIGYQRLLYNWYLSIILLYIGKTTINDITSNIDINNYFIKKVNIAMDIIPKILFSVNKYSNEYIDKVIEDNIDTNSNEFKEFLIEYKKLKNKKDLNIIEDAEFIAVKKIANITNNILIKKGIEYDKEIINLSIEQSLFDKFIYDKEINNLDNYKDYNKIIIYTKFNNNLNFNKLNISETLSIDENINSSYNQLKYKQGELVGMAGFLFKEREKIRLEIKNIEDNIKKLKESKSKYIYSIINPIEIIKSENNKNKIEINNGKQSFIIIICSNNKFYEFDKKNNFNDLINSKHLFNLLEIYCPDKIKELKIIKPNQIELPNKDFYLIKFINNYKKNKKNIIERGKNFKFNIPNVDYENNDDIFANYEKCIVNVNSNKNIEKKYLEIKKIIIDNVKNEIVNQFIVDLDKIFDKMKRYICFSSIYNNINNYPNNYQKYINIAQQECDLLFQSINDYLIQYKS